MANEGGRWWAGDREGSQSVRAGFRVAGIFLLFGVLWIILSDRALTAVTQDMDTLLWLQTAKGWIFVLGTALLIFALVAREVRARLKVLSELQAAQVHLADFINRSGDPVCYWRMPEGLRTDLPIEEQIRMMYQAVCVDASNAYSY